MPKGGKSKKKKDKQQEDGGATALGLSSVTLGLDEDSESVCSSLPDSIVSDDVDTVEDSDSDTDLQFQLSESIDQLIDKNTKTRLAGLKYLNGLFRSKMVGHLLTGREETVTDIITRGLKKNRGEERCSLLCLVSLLAVQLGEEHHSLFSLLKPVLSAIVRDHTVSQQERSMALSTWSFLCFFLSQDFQEVESLMHECELVMHSVKIDSIVASAVKAWCLLLSVIPNHVIPGLVSSELSNLSQLLEKSSDLSVKVATGQAIALLLEIARDTDEELMDSDEVDTACEVIQSVAAESNRYTGRKERSQQRSCFRELVAAVELGEVPERCVRFGPETLQLDSWAKLTQYNTITELLGTGTKVHLQSNDTLRDVFQLGAPPSLERKATKADKIERKLYNAACAKYRSQSRGKQRDKRSVL